MIGHAPAIPTTTPAILILRPEPGAAATLKAARMLGLDAQAFPLFAIRPLAWQPVPRAQVDALLLGSANALRHAGGALGGYAGLPAYAVGETTAQAARKAGFAVVATGRGGLQTLLSGLAPAHRRLLRLAGRERVELAVPSGVTIATREVYAAEPLPPSPALIERLRHPVLALLHSGEAAMRFTEICDAAAIDRRMVRLATIGERVAARAGSGWGALRCADSPDDAALLALAMRMCQEAGSGPSDRHNDPH